MEDALWGKGSHLGFPFLRYMSPQNPSKVSAWGELCPAKDMSGSPGFSSHCQVSPIYASPSSLQEAPGPLVLLSEEPLKGSGHLPPCSPLHIQGSSGSSSVKKEAVLF